MNTSRSFLSAALSVLTSAALAIGLCVSAAAPASADGGTLAPEHAVPNYAAAKKSPIYDPFYDDPVDPAQLTAPGKLLREQSAPQLLNLLNDEKLPGHARKILYTSTTVHGKIVPVSGFVIEPANPWRGKGPTPTVVFGPGTRGAGDACAPSRGNLLLAKFDASNGALGLNYEILNYQAASLMGMRVVVTDYIGLGTPGPHSYVIHDEEAHAMLDAARATVPKGDPVAFWGYSQGGGASAAAAEQHASYAPELNVKGTYSGAPPADLIATMRGVEGSAILGVLGFAVEGMTDRFPQFKAVIDRSVSPRGREFVDSTKNACIGDAALRWGLRDSRTFTVTKETITDAVLKDPEIVSLLDSQKLGRRKPSAPIMVGTGGSDDLVPTPQVIQMARDHCALGANVTLVNDKLPPIGPKIGIDHALPMLTQVVPSMMWLVDRFNDVPAGSNCGGF